MSIKNKIYYYYWASYRRKLLDKLQQEHTSLYKGVVLDIGGRDRGHFKKPKDKVEKWIFADIEAKHNPDIILDVADMKAIESQSIDVVTAIELFEHVESIEKGIKECHRVLKSGGTMIISVPFIHPIHADPYDYQRWTHYKWKNILEATDFSIISLKSMGGYTTVLADMLRWKIKSLPIYIRVFFLVFYPILDLLFIFDRQKDKDPQLAYTTGYFIIARK